MPVGRPEPSSLFSRLPETGLYPPGEGLGVGAAQREDLKTQATKRPHPVIPVSLPDSSLHIKTRIPRCTRKVANVKSRNKNTATDKSGSEETGNYVRKRRTSTPKISTISGR